MNKPLVLVVEDDTPVRNLITTTLKTHEYRYLSAQNGASAVMEALSHNPDIARYGRRGDHPKNPFVVKYADHCDQRQNRGF